MNKLNLKIKLAFITGLQQIVVDEVSRYPDMRILSKEIDCLYLDLSQKYLNTLGLKSISRAFVVVQDSRYNPTYISKHKSIIGELVNMVISIDKKNFKSFKITCAGSDSPEVRSIVRYIQKKYNVV